MGSGYSVEGQVTGKEKFGGLQIEVIPSYRRNLNAWGYAPKPGEPEQAYFPELDEEKTPADLGLKPSDKLRVHPYPPFAMVPIQISNLPKRNSSNKIYLDVPGSEDPPIRLGRLLPEYARLDFSGRLLSMMETRASEPRFNSHPSQVHINSDALQVKARNLRAMGLSAGGKLVQDIVRDKNAVAIWNLQNAKLVNVHIIDPASCEQATHIVPEPPMDTQTYIDADLPFFVVEENADNRLDEGDFHHVVSVSEMHKKIGVTTQSEFNPNRPKMCEECLLRLCDCM